MPVRLSAFNLRFGNRIKKHPMKKVLFGWLAFMLAAPIMAQTNASSNLLHRIHQIQNPSRVLYVAAHPDDENTRMISWLANDIGAETAYLSLTRGDGGQNLIGTELSAQLGVLRTQELMQARALDGGQQFFSRAVDFGYSKNPEETFQQWDKEQVLSDVVRVIRKFKPHIIITRFPPDARAGHGHHTASAMLALEAFEKAADEDEFKEQGLAPWQVKRIFWNHSAWWQRNIDSLAKADPSYFVVDVGTYVPEIGLSCNELASYSRSQHKSQGFGVSVARGSTKEYLKLMKGEPGESIFDGLPQSWSDLDQADWAKALKEIEEAYDPSAPHKMLGPILKALKIVGAKPSTEANSHQYLLSALSQLAADALGLKLELLANEEYAVPGTTVNFRARAIQRSPLEVRITKPSSNWGQYLKSSIQEIELPNNELIQEELSLEIPSNISSQPYWLAEDYQAMFKVANPELIGLPENRAVQSVRVQVTTEKGNFALDVPARYKFSDRVEGEIERPMMVVPALTVSSRVEKLFFLDENSKSLDLDFRAFQKGNYEVVLKAENCVLKPDVFGLIYEGGNTIQSRTIEVQVSADNGPVNLEIYLRETKEGQDIPQLTPLKKLVEIDYSHIDKRMILEEPGISFIPLDIKTKGEKIAYIMGAGDKVAEGISQIGYQVDILDEQSFRDADLSSYQAVVLGIRAYNTQAWLFNRKAQLEDYMNNGGNVIVQYNTRSRSFNAEDFAPYPFTLSRERVTEEDAEVNFVQAAHPVLTEPNAISQSDFDNWVQERGLYFASEWDSRYQAPLAWHDQGEPDRLGGLLIAKYGKGAFIYTGISFFRELPAGVPGAYRLLANLISYQHGGE